MDAVRVGALVYVGHVVPILASKLWLLLPFGFGRLLTDGNYKLLVEESLVLPSNFGVHGI